MILGNVDYIQNKVHLLFKVTEVAKRKTQTVKQTFERGKGTSSQ